MRTQIDLEWADGVYTFALPISLIAELQRKTRTGIGQLYARLLKGRYFIPNVDGGLDAVGDPAQADFNIEDVMEPIRLGLIGGKHAVVNGQDVDVTPTRAAQLMEIYSYPARPLREAWDLAVAILSVCIEGWQEPDPLKKKEQDEPPGKMTATDGLTGSAPSPTSQPATNQSPSQMKSALRNTKPLRSDGTKRTKKTTIP